ncbi:hypothetical protein [Puia sp.]|uniref:hypothetical protein n=1 Tax=Puia sp. TaxID=2045100 RepID=UPI002F4163F7
MQAPNSNPIQSLASGQRYRVNSFDLGFINVHPVDLLVEVKTVCYDTHELELAPLPAAGGAVNETHVQVAQWFRESYPTRSKDDCLLKNALAFERLVETGAATPEKLRVVTPYAGS